MTRTTSKIKIAGSWTGVLEVEIDEWTLPMLRREIANRSSSTPDAIKLICAGRVLKDGNGTETLSTLGLKENSKILSTRTSQLSKDDLATAEERNARLARIKSATDALSKRHSCGKLTQDDFNIELEDQEGRLLKIPEEDRKALMMCLMLHSFGHRLMGKGKYDDALEVLLMADESSSLCNKATIEKVDNIAILQIDIVWCYFKLGDVKWLSTAGERLEKAWVGLAKSHGKNVECFRRSQPGSAIDVHLYLKLELMEGVIAYHTDRLERAKELLTAAESKFSQLNVSDESLSLLMSLGYGTTQAKRALRMHNQNESAAVSFLIQEEDKRLVKDEENRERRAELREQRKYGETLSKRGVDIKMLRNLENIGYDRRISAEALRRNDNDFDLALDELMDPDANMDILESLESRKRIGQSPEVDSGSPSLVGEDDEAAEASGELNSNEGHLMELGSSSSGKKRDADMEGEITAELENRDPMSDYDIDIVAAGEALYQYISLVNAAVALRK